MLCLVVLNYILVRCPWLITTKETIQPIQPNWLLCFFCDDGTCRKTLNLGLPRTNPASSSNGRLQNIPYFCVFKYAWAVKQKVWNEAENRERDWGETLRFKVVWTTMKCPHLLKIDTAYKLYASDTTEMLAKIVKEKKYNPRWGTEQSSPLVLLKCEETRHGRHKTFSSMLIPRRRWGFKSFV